MARPEDIIDQLMADLMATGRSAYRMDENGECERIDPLNFLPQDLIRRKWMNPDFRRDAKTMRYCEMCQRDLKEGQPHRIIRYELDRYEAIHPDDWERAAVEIPPTRAEHLHDHVLITGRIGMDCARRLGLEWSREP